MRMKTVVPDCGRHQNRRGLQAAQLVAQSDRRRLGRQSFDATGAAFA
jgi:hypothetical protein